MRTPPFCPNPSCRCHYSNGFHRDAPEQGSEGSKKSWFIRKGFYTSHRSGRVHRFQCRFCATGFSEQTFSLDYFAKRTVSYSRIEEMVCSTASLRDIARVLHISLGTVSNRISRLARQAMAGHTEYLRHFTPKEALVADGFESFVWSQFFPNNINLLVTADSQLLLGATYCTIRRKGSMTEAQKKRRAELEALFRPPGGVIKHAFAELMDEAVALVDRQYRRSGEAVELRSDEKREYRLALAEHPFYRNLSRHGKLLHRTVSSRAARTVHNPLFAVNYFDREIRKDMANHVRETVCFARNVNAAMERLWIYVVHHNLIKRYRERRPRRDKSTHASMAGIAVGTVRRVRLHYFTRRAFFSKAGALPASLLLLWRRQLETPLQPDGARLLPRYAIA